jgi:ATP-dependent Clp protease ATP-binding subunit ClpA
MFEQYRPRARRAIFYARYDAGRLGSPQIESEHILLGIAREDEPLLARFLAAGATDASIRSQIVRDTPLGDGIPIAVDLPLSDACNRILAYAEEEAAHLGNAEVGTEHIFLGLLREESSPAARILRERGAELETVRAELARAPINDAGTGEKPASLFASLIEKTRLTVSANDQHFLTDFERYTEKARRAVFFSRYEAHQSGAAAIEPHHLLLGILRELELDRYRFLGSDVTLATVRDQIVDQSGPAGSPLPTADLPLGEETRLALDFGAEEADQTGWPTIGPEHLLLGIFRVPDTLAARILVAHRAAPVRIRQLLAADADGRAQSESIP